MKKIVILISGRGSNMQAIVRACADEHWPARIVAVIADRSGAPGLFWAAARGLTTAVVERQAFDDPQTFEAALAQAIDGFASDLIALAGFMRILSPDFVARYSARLLNIHPSLLPSFRGLRTHQRALEAGVKLHGATVHFVTTDLDWGPVIIQAAVPVRVDDTIASLAARVLRCEHLIYPRAMRWFVEGHLRFEGMRVTVLARQGQYEPQWLMEEGA